MRVLEPVSEKDRASFLGVTTCFRGGGKREGDSDLPVFLLLQRHDAVFCSVLF
jgi:hypothetical protein